MSPVFIIVISGGLEWKRKYTKKPHARRLSYGWRIFFVMCDYRVPSSFLG